MKNIVEKKIQVDIKIYIGKMLLLTSFISYTLSRIIAVT